MLWWTAALNAYFERQERVALDESQSRTTQRMDAPSIRWGCDADRFAIINIVYYSSLCTVHHLPALISSYLAGDNTSSKKLPATKDSTV